MKRPFKGKIFCIGLPKTGTMSLSQALTSLGYKTVHYPINDVIPKFHQGDYIALDNYDAYANCGEWHFAALDKVYPGSLFIYTWRSYDDWIVSIKKHFDRYPIPGKTEIPYHNRLEVFSVVTFSEPVLETIYHAHAAAVERYFHSRNNLLKLNVAESDAYNNLGEFLGITCPPGNFPHLNKA